MDVTRNFNYLGVSTYGSLESLSFTYYSFIYGPNPIQPNINLSFLLPRYFTPIL